MSHSYPKPQIKFWASLGMETISSKGGKNDFRIFSDHRVMPPWIFRAISSACGDADYYWLIQIWREGSFYFDTWTEAAQNFARFWMIIFFLLFTIRAQKMLMWTTSQHDSEWRLNAFSLNAFCMLWFVAKRYPVWLPARLGGSGHVYQHIRTWWIQDRNLGLVRFRLWFYAIALKQMKLEPLVCIFIYILKKKKIIFFLFWFFIFWFVFCLQSL